MPVGEDVHLFHLQHVREGTSGTKEGADYLGYAISRNLIDWEEQAARFGPNPEDARDDWQPWTGCALWHQGLGYLYYTMRGSAENGKIQRIGLATSRDAIHWQRHAGNPVITPDPRWYASPGIPVPGILDCRDLTIVAEPHGTGWFGYYATRIPGAELPETSVIACVYSPDLIHWEHRPPAFAPGTYACLEVPEVFELNGKWYLTCLVGNYYGNRGIWSDPNLVNGTMYAVAEGPEGPFVELADNALIAARTTGPISCRSLLFEKERYVLYTDRERKDFNDDGGMTVGTLSTPKILTTSGDRLIAKYSPLIESRVGRELLGKTQPPQPRTDVVWGQLWPMASARWEFGETITGESRTGWGLLPLDVQAESYIFEARVHLEHGVAAGLGLRIFAQMRGSVAAIDAQEGTVFYSEIPAFDWDEKRLTPIAVGRTYHLKVVSRLEHLEVYVDDELRLTFSRYRGIGGEVGLFVDRARAHFSDIRLRELMVKRGND